MIPCLAVTIYRELNFYPEVFSVSWDYLYKRPWFRVTPFVFGLVLGIVKFEFRYVEKLNNGRKPEHKKFLSALKFQKTKQKVLTLLGIFMMVFPIVLIILNALCVD
mmetsp:Transcript_38631/g.36986  ORF Transcript_38631/g.36986 Transcript_38631/m.36986 type:complete len:106 (-) Transcript_38631:1001-1318(-)